MLWDGGHNVTYRRIDMEDKSFMNKQLRIEPLLNLMTESAAAPQLDGVLKERNYSPDAVNSTFFSNYFSLLVNLFQDQILTINQTNSVILGSGRIGDVASKTEIARRRASTRQQGRTSRNCRQIT